MKTLLLKTVCFPLDLIYLTIDGSVVTFRRVARLFKRQKMQRCHFCQGESNQDAPHPVRAVLKYQNKWMVKFLAPCIRFKTDGKRCVGFCKLEGDLTRPPAWVPVLTLGLFAGWLGGTYLILRSISSDPDNFGRNFIAYFNPRALGEDESEPDFLDVGEARLNPERAERYFMSGLRYFDQQNFASAQVDFKIAIQSNPSDPNLHFHLAKSYLATGQMVQGEASVRRTLEFDEDHVEALIMLAELMERRENRQDAMRHAERALSLEPENPQAIRLKAGLLASVGNQDRTRELVDRLYTIDGNNVSTLAFLGRLELTLFQDVESAKARIQSALELNENHVPSLLVWVSIQGQEQNAGQMEQTLNQVLELAPENIQAHRMRAELILNRFGLNAGLRAYSQLLNRFGGDLGLRLRYAELLLRAGNISEGKRLAQQLTASRVPQFERASHWMLAQMYAQVRMFEEAVQHARSTLRVTPNEPNIHLFLAQQLLALDRPAEALREAEAAFSLNRQDFRALNAVTVAMIRLDRTQEAVEILGRHMEEFPDQDAVALRRIEILMQSPDWREALPETRRLYNKYPDNPALRNNLAFLLARSGENLDEALALAESLKANFPEEAVILDTYAYVLAARGDHEGALPVYETALSKAQENVTIRYHYVKSLLEMGRQEDAMRHLEAVLMINPSFPEADEARALFQSLTGGAPS